ncbi:hypothetical protein [Parapedobacter pyrenivorans]|nr:hypothetical protein [Parapedobacter pyrenivorans]
MSGSRSPISQLTIRWDHSGQASGSDRLMLLLYDGEIFRYFREIGTM